ncbi:MAG: PrgI family protein [Patescibacteria group bacterium]|nr:PrgI family protein [Patescibacteria group bacterium]
MEKKSSELKKQHPVPQNIMEVEFKLVGDMTLRQFGYVAGGAVLGFIIYSQPLPSVIRWPIILFIATIALGMAFVPMEERGLDEWIRNYFIASYSPTRRAWKKSKFSSKSRAKANKKEEKSKPEKEEKEEVEKLGKELREKIQEAKEEQGKSKEDLEKKAGEISKNLDQILKAMGKRSNENLSEKELREENMLLKKRLATIGEEYKRLKELEGAEETPANLKQTIKYYKDQLETLEEKNRALQKELKEKEQKRGKKEPKDIGKETKELKKHIQSLEEKNKNLEEKLAALNKSVKEFEAKATELQKEKETYQKKLEEKSSELRELEDQRNRAVGKMMKMKKQLEGQTTEPQKEEKKVIPKKEKAKMSSKKEKEKKLKQKIKEEQDLAPIINNVPNIINGIVKDNTGDLVEGQMVIIEDEDGDPVRALKTNKLGQFAVSTPLPNGKYTVKVSNGHYQPTKVVVGGSVLDPIVFKENK